MKTRLTLKPGQKGTKNLIDQYGEKLLCVRYRYDETTNKRFKTIELIIEETTWATTEKEIEANAVVGLKVGYEEKELQNIIKKEGGVWDKQKKLWFLEHTKVVESGLSDRISK